MTQEIYFEKVGDLLKVKKRLEKELKIKIHNQGKNVFIEGDGISEFLGLKILEAMNLGFSIDRALLLKNEENVFHTINIKDVTKRHDLERVRARIIGTHGGTIANLSKLSECQLSLKDNTLGVIGHVDCIELAVDSFVSLIRGSKQASVYSRLEKKGKKRRKEPKKNIRDEFDEDEEEKNDEEI